MKMFEQTGEFTPDSLIASADFPILKEGIGLKAGQGILKRGSLIIRSEKAGYIAGATITTGSGETAKSEEVKGKIFGILTDDTDTGTDAAGDNIPAVCYHTGVFNRDAVIVTGTDESGKNATVDKYEDDMRDVSLFLRNVQNY